MTYRHATSLAPAVLALAAAGAVALAASDPVGTKTLRYDVLVGRRAAGQMRLEIMTVSDLTILEERFTAPYRGTGREVEAGYTSQVVYKGAGKPAPSRAEITTRVGRFKIMAGKVTFTKADGRWSAAVEATGFADKEGKPFETAREFTRTFTAEGDLLLTPAAFLYFAPRLLPEPGKIENVVQVELPDDINFPAMLNFKPDCILERHVAGADGKAEITLHRVYAGGNIVPLLKMTVDKAGQAEEMSLGKFTLRRAASALEE
ncbi:MAG: hypothetical protein R6X20_10515 [Phycisphaerae bacterium]